MDENAQRILLRLQNECSKREYCSSDVFQKARKAIEGDERQAAEIVEALLKDKYVDDLRYASAFAREKAYLQGWGRVKISYMLKLKFIPKDIVYKALEEIDESTACDKMRSLLLAKHRLLKDDPQSKFKLLKYALSRGYDYDELRPVVEEIISEAKADNQ